MNDKKEFWLSGTVEEIRKDHLPKITNRGRRYAGEDVLTLLTEYDILNERLVATEKEAARVISHLGPALARVKEEDALGVISNGLECESPCDMSTTAKCSSCGHKPYQRWCAGCIARAVLSSKKKE